MINFILVVIIILLVWCICRLWYRRPLDNSDGDIVITVEKNSDDKVYELYLVLNDDSVIDKLIDTRVGVFNVKVKN